MSSNHLVLCHPLLLLPSIFPSNKVFSNESALLMEEKSFRWLKYWSFSFSISSSTEYSGLISFRRRYLIPELNVVLYPLIIFIFRSPPLNMPQIFIGFLKMWFPKLSIISHYCEVRLCVQKKTIRVAIIGLVKNFIWLFPNILWKNPNKLFGQPNVLVQSEMSSLSVFSNYKEVLADICVKHINFLFFKNKIIFFHFVFYNKSFISQMIK